MKIKWESREHIRVREKRKLKRISNEKVKSENGERK